MEITSLAAFLMSLAAGGGTFLAAKWLLEQFPNWGIVLSQRGRFFAVYGLCFVLAGSAYGAQVWLEYVVFSVDGLFVAGVTAFAASQALWGAFEARKVVGSKE